MHSAIGIVCVGGFFNLLVHEPHCRGDLETLMKTIDQAMKIVAKASLTVRWMTRSDLPAVVAIEQASFEHAWTEQEFIDCLCQRNYIGQVAECGEKIIGFMIYELRKGELHLVSFAVHPSWRRKDVGQRMVRKLIGKLLPRRPRIALEVRESNLAAQLFFKGQGFHAVKVLRDFYEPLEDAYLMVYNYYGVNRIAKYYE